MVRKGADQRWFQSDYFVWGWYPARWQGWGVLLLFLGVLLYGSWVLLPRDWLMPFDEQRILVWLLFVSAIISGLVLVVWRTGGRPQRGDDGKDAKK